MKSLLSAATLVFALSGPAVYASAPFSGESFVSSGLHEGIGFRVEGVAMDYLTLTWDDGNPGFTANYNPNPNPAPRCPCHVYEFVSGRVLRQVVLSYPISSERKYDRANYYRWSPFNP